MPQVGESVGARRRETEGRMGGTTLGTPPPFLPLITVLTLCLRLNNNRSFPVCLLRIIIWTLWREFLQLTLATHVRTQGPLLVVETLLYLQQNESDLSENDVLHTEPSRLWIFKKYICDEALHAESDVLWYWDCMIIQSTPLKCIQVSTLCFLANWKVKKSPTIWFHVSLTLRQWEMNIRGFVLAFIRSCRYLEMGMQAWGGVDGSQPSKPFSPRPFCESTLISLSSTEKQDCGPGCITSVNVSWC